MDNISFLPEEILLEIISSVHNMNTLLSLQLVSKLFNRIANDKNHHKVLIHHNNINVSRYSQYSNLEQIKGLLKVDEKQLTELAKLPKLWNAKFLISDSSRMDKLVIQFFSKRLPLGFRSKNMILHEVKQYFTFYCNKSIFSINNDTVIFHNIYGERYFELLYVLKIRKLRFDSTFVSTKSLKKIYNMPHLREFELIFGSIPFSEIKSLPLNLRRFKLKFPHKIAPQVMDQLFSNIISNPYMKNLEILETPITLHTLIRSRKVIEKEMPNLKIIGLLLTRKEVIPIDLIEKYQKIIIYPYDDQIVGSTKGGLFHSYYHPIKFFKIKYQRQIKEGKIKVRSLKH